MALSTRIREHIRHNLWGIVAVFIALGGTAAALPGKNTIDSGDIKKAQVKRGDLAPNSVDGSKVTDDSLKGADVDEASLNIPQQALPTSLPPSGAAGGDLSGTYPAPEVLESGLIPGGDLSGTLAAAQVSEAGLTAAGDITGALNATAIANNSIGVQEPGVNANDEIVDQGVDTEDVRNNDLTTTDIAVDTLTNADIANNDTIGDQELDDVERRIVIPAGQIGAASLLGANPATLTIRGNAPALAFQPNAPDQGVDIAVQAPEDRVAGTPVNVRVLFSGTGAGTIAWTLAARSATELTADTVNGVLTVGTPIAAGPGTDNTLRAGDLGDLAGVVSFADGDMLILRIFRDADQVGGLDDNLNPAFLHFIEIAYTAER